MKTLESQQATLNGLSASVGGRPDVVSDPQSNGNPTSYWRLGALVLFLSAFPLQAQPFAIPWFKIAGGGVTQGAGGPYTLGGTIGQFDAGRVAGGAFRSEGGFWGIQIQQLGFPRLNIAAAGNDLTVSWFTAEPGLILQRAETLTAPAPWSDVGAPVVTVDLTSSVTLGIATSVTNHFYRLRRP